MTPPTPCQRARLAVLGLPVLALAWVLLTTVLAVRAVGLEGRR